MNAVELENVTKRFGDLVAVDRLDLVVPEGAIYGFIGPNGSGKTTTLRMILRILYPESGRISVLGAIEAGWPTIAWVTCPRNADCISGCGCAIC